MVEQGREAVVYRRRRRFSSEQREFGWEEMLPIDGFSLLLLFPQQPVPGWDGKKNKTEAIRNPKSRGLGGSQSSPSSETLKPSNDVMKRCPIL